MIGLGKTIIRSLEITLRTVLANLQNVVVIFGRIEFRHLVIESEFVATEQSLGWCLDFS